MKKEQKTKKTKLNDGLCPEEFKICVPKECGLLEQWKEPVRWFAYLKTLTSDPKLVEAYKPPSETQDYSEQDSSRREKQAEPGSTNEDPCSREPKPPTCWSCDCREGWELRGELAILHACRVHERIHRQVLGFEDVSAVDVGFAIWERQTMFGDFLAIRIHVNKKRPPEQLLRAGLATFTQPFYAFPSTVLRSLRAGRLDLRTIEGRGVLTPEGAPGPAFEERHRCCPHPEKHARLMELLSRELGDDHRGIERAFNRYPISGVRREDLSIFCPRKIAETRTLDDIRLCICGVPIDIVNAEYRPSIFHPGGDAESGIFVDPPEGSVEQPDDEHLLTGRGRVNPLVGGISVGSVTGQAGTLGTIVWDRTDGTPCVLSNWHVLAGTPAARVGQPTYQPALFDGGTEEDVIAHLKRWRLSEDGDAAIAELTGRRYYAAGEVLGLWHPIAGYQKPRLNLEIRKWGRSSGFTQGFIDGICLATNIDYGNEVVRYFRDQFHIAPLFAGQDVSQVGDSGSLVVTSLRPVDLRRDLDRLCEWLRDCCGQGRIVLCAEIAEAFPELRKGCEPVQEHCSDLCTYLASLDIAECKNLSTENLHYQIETARDEIKKRCKTYSKYLKCFLRVEAEIDRLFEQCCRCRFNNEELWEELRRIFEVLPEECIEYLTTLAQLPNKCHKMIKNDYKEIKDQLTCADIATLRRILKAIFTALRECSRFCGRVAECFDDWHERCREVLTGEARCREICKILADQDKCRDTTCKDPGELVRCIKEHLRDPGGNQERQGSLNPDHVLDALRRGLELDHKKLSAVLGNAARKYTEDLDDEEARRAVRTYFAVGMIFAGDTPGSPFGEFAVASEISKLADVLRFSLRPVFEPRSSFRELRVRPLSERSDVRAPRSDTGLAPGAPRDDPRGGGPQPDLEPAQSSSSSRTGGGGGG